MAKPEKSGPAKLMDAVMILTAALAAVCFTVHYGFFKNAVILWTGVAAFTALYQLWLRLALGKAVGRFKSRIRYDGWLYRERKFEKKLYKALRVKKWKDKVPTFNPELFVLSDFTMEEIAVTMAKVETDHWVNVLISLSTLLFALIWGAWWIFFAVAMAAIAFDGQFIAIQRYNRPRVVRLINRRRTAAV